MLRIALLVAILIAYSNSFENSFHFDDFHTITENPALRSLKNVPRFFTDATTFSVLPANRTYRPIVSTSLAFDYAMGHGYNPVWFHISTFLIFLGEVLLLEALYRLLLDKIRPGPANAWLALFGAAWFGLHPAIAETINYVIQRGDLYCTVGCVAALYLFARYPSLRNKGIYLLPFCLALLSKPPAAVFPLLLLLYVFFFENAEATTAKRWRTAGIAILPSLVVMALLLWLQSAMTPRTFAPSMISATDYRMTQPFVWLRYFGSLFLPIHLNVDTDLNPFSDFDGRMFAGLLFLATLVAAIWMTARRRVLYPIAFGLLWFVITQLPTSLYPLSEMENDHRMFFSFAGLILAVVWAVWLLLERLFSAENLPKLRPAIAAFALLILAAYAYGVHIRNDVWHSEDSLWLDDALKSPHNGRGLMIYGLTLMNKGDYPAALDEFTKALPYTPNYATLEVNLGIVNGAMADQGDASRLPEAERHFQRAISLTPTDDSVHAFYGRWLMAHGRLPEAIHEFQTAIDLDPPRLLQHELLIAAYTNAGDSDAARQAAEATLAIAPDDIPAQQAISHPGLGTTQNEAFWINLSLVQSRAGLYQDSITSARKALALNPNSADAYNNIAAGYGALQQWPEAEKNAREAIRLKPDFQLAKNNLAWFLGEIAKGGHASTSTTNAATPMPQGAANVPVLMSQSLSLGQAGKYEDSITLAHKALQLQPNNADAWNNIAADYEAMHRWDEAIDAAQRAIALRPDFQLAKNNLAWSQSQKKIGVR